MILLQIFDKIARHTYGIELLPDKCKPPECPLPVCWTFSMEKNSCLQTFSHSNGTYPEYNDRFVPPGQPYRRETLHLENMALLPVEGIETETFFDLTELDDFMLIDELIDSSFIQYNYITDVISPASAHCQYHSEK